MRAEGLQAELQVVKTIAGSDRKEWAERCHEIISWHVGRRGFVQQPVRWVLGNVPEIDIQVMPR